MNKRLIAGALFDFLGYLTTREGCLTLGSAHDATPALDMLKEWAKGRGLSLDDADVQNWQKQAITIKVIDGLEPGQAMLLAAGSKVLITNIGADNETKAEADEEAQANS